MAKTKPIGVRFDEELFDALKKADNTVTYQSAFSLYEDFFKQEILNLTKKGNDLPKIYIYKLIDPRNKSVFYVGRTSARLRQRLLGHISQVNIKGKTEHLNYRKISIIKDILKNGVLPEIELIEEVVPIDESELRGFHERESYWISEYIKMGHPVTNRLTIKIMESIQDEKALEVPIPHIPASKREIVKQVLDDSAKERLQKLEAELASLGNSSYLFDYKRKLKAKIDKLKNQ